MAALRSQLSDLEAVEPISQVKHAFFVTQGSIPSDQDSFLGLLV